MMTTTMMTMMTTRRRPRVTTRGRIIAWFLAIVAASLLFTMLLVAQILLELSRQDARAELRHEIGKFRQFAESAVDPVTGERFTDPEALLANYLAEATPEENEALFSVVNGLPGHRTRNPISVRLDTEPSVVSEAADATAEVHGAMDTPRGPVVYAILPVTSEVSDTKAALVVVELWAEKNRQVVRTVQLIGIMSAVSLAIAGGVSWVVAGRVLAPIRQVRETAENIDEDDLTARIPTSDMDADDDVAKLATTFNSMLDRVEGAFAAQRQFLDDAAHELRTPLTVIRGHLELPDAERSEEQHELILDEVERMDRIVGDLLVLAKSDRPDFLFRETVDLADLVLSVAAKSRLLANRAWGVPEAAGCIVTADSQLLTQALMQLVSNAIAATEPGDPIHISSRLVGDDVELVVEDGGPGIPVEERKAVFARFRKGEGASSTGLGLAIVASIIRAHGGDVRIDDSALGGAAIVIRLPGEAVDLIPAHDWYEEDDAPWNES